MEDKEKQKFREHYSMLSDEKLSELLQGGEAGLVEGAYRLVKDEAIKRKLINTDGIVIKKQEPRISLNPRLQWERYRAERIDYSYGHFLKQVFLVCLSFLVVISLSLILRGGGTGEILMPLLILIIGVPLLLSLLWLCYRKLEIITRRFVSKQDAEAIAGKMERYEYISQKDFVLWKRSSRHLPYLTYEEYLQEYNKTPEKREEDRKKTEDFINSPEFKKHSDGLFK